MIPIKTPESSTQYKPLTDLQIATLAKLTLKLASLQIDGEFSSEVYEGPVVTLYKFTPRRRTTVAQVERLAPDMAVALSAEAVQVKRIPGSEFIGIYVPNKNPKPFLFRDAVSEVFKYKDMKIPLCLGQDHEGNVVVEDLVTLPHMLIAGSTGGGKSTLLNGIIATLAYYKTSSQLKIILSDVKQVEFTHFVGLPHLVFPPATSVIRSIEQLDWAEGEINNRLGILAKNGCQNIGQFQERFPGREFPYILIIIDELAELLTSRSKNDQDESLGKLAEYKLATIAQKARASGVHVIAATQRPSVKVVEGNIKSNFPARISFRLPSEADSRTVLATSGAEYLLSKGDMLYVSPNSPAIRRIHAPWAKIEDIQTAVEIAVQKEKGE